MAKYRFLTIEDVLAFHDDTIAHEGGSPGIRAPGMLESAVAMPRASFGGDYLHGDLAGMAAAYLFHICQAHAFVDGNKRAAVLACHAFLDINGVAFTVSPDELFEVVVAVADGSLSKADLTERLRGMFEELG